MDLHDLIAQAKPAARTVELCLRGDLVAETERITRATAIAGDAHDQAALAALVEELAETRALMAESLITVRMEAIPRADWLAALADNPPREGHRVDARNGFDTEGFYDAIIRASWREPDITPTDLDALLDVLSDGQYTELAEAAYSVNARAAVVPFGWRDSRSTPD